VIGVLFIPSLVVLPFQKKFGNCHVVDATIFPASGVYYNTYQSKSMVQKLGFLCGFIAINDELVLLTIKGKRIEAIVHMTESEFLDLLHPKQVQLFISICIYGKFCLLTTFALVGF